jgi:hypothetical protein
VSGRPPAPDSLGRLLEAVADECRALRVSLNGDTPTAGAVLLTPIRQLRAELDGLEERVLETTNAR